MLLYAFRYLIPVKVYLTCVILCLDSVRADRITDGSQTPDLANLTSTIRNRSDVILAKENFSSNTVSLHDNGIPEWLDGYQAESQKKSNFNLAFLPGLAFVFLFIVVAFRVCKWHRESSKVKERGCSYDVASYIILVQGDKHFDDVDIGDNYDTVNSVNSYLRSGAYESITSSKSLQYRMDSQMYDTVTSYSQYLQKIRKENNLEIELKQIPSNGSPSPKRTHFTKKNVKLPQESRFSIKPALDNYMRLKGAYQKSPMSPKCVRYDSVERIDGTARKVGSKVNITVNAASSESLLQSAPNRSYGRQMSVESHRSNPVRGVANGVRLANLRRTVSEDTSRLTQALTRDEMNKKKCNRIKNVSSLTFTEENKELIKNNLCCEPIRMVNAETQCDITTSPSSPSKRRSRLMSHRSDTDSYANDTVTITEHVNTSATAMDHIAEKHMENGEDLLVTVILDGLKTDLSPPEVRPTAFSVCAVVHNIDAVVYPLEQGGETHSEDNNSHTNSDPETGIEMKKQDMEIYDDHMCCLSNGSIYKANRTDNILIENERNHSSLSNGDDVESHDYKKSENGCLKINRKSLPSVSTLSSEGSIFEKGCHLNNGMSHCIARRSSFQNQSKSKQEKTIELQNELSQVQGTFIEMVH